MTKMTKPTKRVKFFYVMQDFMTTITKKSKFVRFCLCSSASYDQDDKKTKSVNFVYVIRDFMTKMTKTAKSVRFSYCRSAFYYPDD